MDKPGSHEKALASFRDGEVLVAHMTTPDWVPLMRRAAAMPSEKIFVGRRVFMKAGKPGPSVIPSAM